MVSVPTPVRVGVKGVEKMCRNGAKLGGNAAWGRWRYTLADEVTRTPSYQGRRNNTFDHDFQFY